MTPPRLATWLLQHLNGTNEALAGDLLEEYRHGRSAAWYWRQVMSAILVGQPQALSGRTRLGISTLSFIVGFVVAFAFIRPITAFVLQPIAQLRPGSTFIYTTPNGAGIGIVAFGVHVTIAAFVGLIVAMPVMLYQTWLAAARRHARQRWFAMRFGFLTTVCFLGGALFSHFVLFPWFWQFLTGFVPDASQVPPRLLPVLSLYAKLVLTCGLAFQMPSSVLLLARVGAVTRDLLARNFLYAALVIISIAAFVTPTGDPVTLMFAAAPLFAVYGLSVLIAWRFEAHSDAVAPDPSAP